MRCAYDLTEPARKKIEAERDAEIAAKKAEGKSNAQIAREHGVHKATVGRRVAELQAAKTQPSEALPGQALFDDMTRWWGALPRCRGGDQPGAGV